MEKILQENTELANRLEGLEKEKLASVKRTLKQKIEKIGDINFIGAVIDMEDAGALRDLSYQLKGEVENMFLILGNGSGNKAALSIMISDNLVKEMNLNAANLIKDCAKEIHGGGGGQPFFATAGGKNPGGLQNAIDKARSVIAAG